MREGHIEYLRCPACGGVLGLADAVYGAGDRIERGLLRCQDCRAAYPIAGYIPRFVIDEGYAEGFGLEWNVHRRTQYDRVSGAGLSERRFFEETGWPRQLDGEVLIEAGSGSGRFTEHALATGAIVLSLDYSRAVEANYASNGAHENLVLVQGDLFRMPFAPDVADRLFCFGVLQHTPDPQAALRSIVGHVRPGGEIVADIYAKTLTKYVLGTKYWVRPVTRRMAPDRLYGFTSRYVDALWPVARRVRRVPRIGRALNWRLLIGDYSGLIDDDERLRDWARLDTFDMLAPRYDNPARESTARRWCNDLGLVAVDVHPGYNGIEIHARRPARAASLHAV
jgi:SAM-dependent methyltransferase